jgi:hypothetical protein
MKWCCIPFKTWYEAAGERGAAILVGRNSGGKPEFIIQHRAVDKGIDLLPPTEFPVTLISEIDISYCPWCGRKLDKWYRDSVDDLYRPDLKISS